MVNERFTQIHPGWLFIDPGRQFLKSWRLFVNPGSTSTNRWLTHAICQCHVIISSLGLTIYIYIYISLSYPKFQSFWNFSSGRAFFEANIFKNSNLCACLICSSYYFLNQSKVVTQNQLLNRLIWGNKNSFYKYSLTRNCLGHLGLYFLYSGFNVYFERL